MLWTIAVVLIVLWLLGLVTSYTMGGLIHILLVIAIIMILVLLVMIGIWLIKFLFGLFKCYATVLFKIILGPLEIGMGAFPNSKIGFGTWILDVIANLAVFPISFLFLVISNLIIVNIIFGGTVSTWTEIFKGNILGGGMWTPAILGGDLTSFALRPVGGIAAMAIGVATLLLLSKLPEMIPQYIFMLKPSPWGTAIGESFTKNAVVGAGKMAWTGAKQYGHNILDETAEDNPDSPKGHAAGIVRDVLELTGQAKPTHNK